MPGSGSDNVLYGETPPRLKQRNFVPLEGVVPNPYPDGLVTGGSWFPTAIVDNAVPELLPHSELNEDAAAVALAALQTQIPAALSSEAVRPDDMPLHAIIIEPLPAWAEPRKVHEEYFVSYGEHLGIGIYAYDLENACWYQRAMHGGFGTAGALHPFKKRKTASKQADKLKQELLSGSYKALDFLYQDYPVELYRLNERLGAKTPV